MGDMTVEDVLKMIPDEGDTRRIRVGGAVIEVENKGTFAVVCPECFHPLDDRTSRFVGPGHRPGMPCLAVVGHGICSCARR